jgi:hypothetical protein
MEIGPVENGLGERAMDLGQGGHEVLQRHEDLAAALCCGSVTFFGVDPDPAIFVIDLSKIQTKNYFFFIVFSKKKSQKEVTKQ